MSTLSLWTRRDPFAEFDALLRRAFGPIEPRPAGFTPAAEITRDGDDAVIHVELPGLDPAKDVTVEIEGGALVIRGERRDEFTEKRDGRGLHEVRYGSFLRTFDLPSHVTADAVSASYDAGVLTVRVVGAYTGSQTRRIPIAGGAGPEAVKTS
jgi:HSP20 family protein